MYGLQWHFGVIFPSQDTIRSIILFTMYYFTSFYCNKYLSSLHYAEILNSIIIPSTPYRTWQARSLSRRATPSHPILRKDKFTTNINLWQFPVVNTVDLLIQTLIRLISRPTILISFFLSSLVVPKKITTGYIWSHTKEKPHQRDSLRKSFRRKSRPLVVFSSFNESKVYSLINIFKNNGYFLPKINY